MEQNGGTYRKQSDYFIPDFALSESKESNIGIYGQQHLRYSQEHRKITYMNLLTSENLNEYLTDIDNQAQEKFELLVTQMKETQMLLNNEKLTILWSGSKE